ncbi:hypothetical protein CGLAU_00785 [Corynebacterium glaucum]|uniref:Uncharacterized protein n=1 Tax=Corynebacterium glaucum TaxID=187491 RepID=A0A1Q2HTJ3_9CORY|nr:hypothetical protein [Corynebacterium glaucum]AQQ14152.1 hypothetical protein CGLAU_00785 [Corynebacterium glaucum]WJZ06674.1 hypothetical protein CGLAUT_00800 [Corynebacterium glaucum]
MSARRAVTAIAACAVALTTITTPAQAATLGPRGSDNHCQVTLTPGEKKFAQKLFDDSKTLGPYERSRDLVKAIETVFPDAAKVGSTLFENATATTKPEISTEQREALKAAGLNDDLIFDYTSARLLLKTVEPTTAVTLEGIDLDNLRVRAGTESPVLDPIPLNNVGKMDKATLDKLVAAWEATPAGDAHKRSNQIAASDRQAAEACALGTSKQVVYPEISTAPTLDLSSTLSSKQSNFDVVVGALITIIAAIVGGALALPNLGIKLPF